MKPQAIDVMARLSAADPARHVALDEDQRRRLWRLIAASPGGGSAPWRARKRLARLTLAIGVLLILAVVALAASGLIGVGKPAEPASGSTPAKQGGELVQANVRLLPLITELHYWGGEVGAGGWLQFSSEHVR
jgi:hypothetical protein